jgi:hypothetical protein
MDTIKLAAQLQGLTLLKPSSGNQRAYADLLEERACNIAAAEYAQKFSPARTVRSPEDFMITADGISNLVDVKTRQLGTDFNMPNLISVDRLDKILSNSTQELYYWMIDYRVNKDGSCTVEHSEIRTVWSLPWPALAIQNLGKGQLQICKWDKVAEHASDKDAWHAQLKEQRKKFYHKQIAKLQRILDSIK